VAALRRKEAALFPGSATARSGADFNFAVEMHLQRKDALVGVSHQLSNQGLDWPKTQWVQG
jgi:hypothetical protein